jgi:preprotein translocase subunit YajC
MQSFLHYLLMGTSQGGGTGEGGGGGSWISFLMFPAIIAIFYFLIIRPQNKKQKETQKMLAALKKGDRVVTIGGVHGTIQSVKETSQTVIIKVDDNVKVEFSRSAVSTVEAAAKEDKDEKETEALSSESEKK